MYTPAVSPVRRVQCTAGGLPSLAYPAGLGTGVMDHIWSCIFLGYRILVRKFQQTSLSCHIDVKFVATHPILYTCVLHGNEDGPVMLSTLCYWYDISSFRLVNNKCNVVAWKCQLVRRVAIDQTH